MQNQNQDDSEHLAIDLPPLPKLPPMIPISTMLLIAFLGSMAAVCFSRSNWIGGFADLGIMILIAIIRYRSMKEIYRHHRNRRNLLTIRKILTTPVMVEEGNSMILTFLRPSDRLLDEMNKMAAEFNSKKESQK